MLNVGAAATASVYAADLALMVGNALVDEAVALGSARVASRAVDCDIWVEGHATAQLVDTDGSGVPSVGDRIDINYDRCHSSSLTTS